MLSLCSKYPDRVVSCALVSPELPYSILPHDEFSSHLKDTWFLDDIRTIAKKNKQYENLNSCDELRDERLKSVRVRLEDAPGKKSI
eukprot:gene12610-6515_t